MQRLLGRTTSLLPFDVVYVGSPDNIIIIICKKVNKLAYKKVLATVVYMIVHYSSLF